MSLILTNENINTLISTKSLHVSRKQQKIRGNFNYFLSPQMCLRIFNCKVLISDPKYIVLEFDKITDSTLYFFLQKISKSLIDYTTSIFNLSEENIFYSLYSDVDSKFTIRCYLPQSQKKYTTKYYVDNEEMPFKCIKPRIFIDQVIIDVKNIWQNNNRIGFNLELAKVYFI
jgi:hypothetical protein